METTTVVKKCITCSPNGHTLSALAIDYQLPLHEHCVHIHYSRTELPTHAHPYIYTRIDDPPHPLPTFTHQYSKPPAPLREQAYYQRVCRTFHAQTLPERAPGRHSIKSLIKTHEVHRNLRSHAANIIRCTHAQTVNFSDKHRDNPALTHVTRTHPRWLLYQYIH